MNPIDTLGAVTCARGTLHHSRAALDRGQLTVGFLGGSITAPGVSWPEPLAAWLGDTFSGVRLAIENAALGATGSELAAIRAQSEILDRGCDLVFVEYATNDFGTESGLRARAREGLLRQLLRAGKCDVVLVYTYCPEMQADMFAGKVPVSIADFELLADHYGLNSVWMGLHAVREVQRGLLRWEDWLPDGLHPTTRGSLCYAQSVMGFLAKALVPGAKARKSRRGALPAALVPGAWEHVRLLPLTAAELSGPWSLRRGTSCPGVMQVLVASAPGAALSLAFTGRGLVLAFDFGRTSGEIRHRIDGGTWTVTQRDCPAWAGDAGWLRPHLITDVLPPGPHRFELEALPGPGNAVRGSRTALGLFGVIECGGLR
ncbi:MAG: SGNH/GDSL hydrolase family protein [Opitutales bacterium]